MIEIKNLRDEFPIEPWQVKVDRSSILGNPFHMKDESERDKVCDMFKHSFALLFDGQIFNEKDELMLAELERLKELYKKYGKLELFCWCSPKRCHAETIKKYLEGENLCGI